MGKEPHDNTKTMGEKLTVWGFRFLSMITGKKRSSRSKAYVQKKAQEYEITLCVDKLQADVAL